VKSELLIGLFLVALVASCNEQSTASSVLFFDGELNDSNVGLALKSLGPEGRITTIRIRSGGGNPVPASRLAEAIRRNRLSIQVQDYCLSACMTFIFPAAQIRAVSKDAILGYHYADSYDVAALEPLFGGDSVKLQKVIDSLSRNVLRHSLVPEQLLIEQGEKLEPQCWTSLSSNQSEKAMVYRFGIWLPSKVSLAQRNLAFTGSLFADTIEVGEVPPIYRKKIADILGIPDPATLPPIVAGGLPSVSPTRTVPKPIKCNTTIVRKIIH
jgi:hypothetical protein